MSKVSPLTPRHLNSSVGIVDRLLIHNLRSSNESRLSQLRHQERALSKARRFLVPLSSEITSSRVEVNSISGMLRVCVLYTRFETKFCVEGKLTPMVWIVHREELF